MWKLISLELIENKLTLVRLVLELYAPVYFRPPGVYTMHRSTSGTQDGIHKFFNSLIRKDV